MSVAPSSGASTQPTHTEPVIKVQSAEESKLQDLALAAAADGVSIEAAAVKDEWARKLGPIQAQLQADYPNEFAGAWLGRTVAEAPVFRFARAVPAGAAALLEGTAIAVDVRENVGYSLAEIDAAAATVHDLLLASGFKSIASGPDIKTDTIQVELQASPVQAIAAQTATLSKIVIPAGVKLRISPTSGAAVVPEHTRGGAWMTLSNNTNWCSSAFTVEHVSTREQGVTTASHCEGLTRYRQPSDGATYSAPWRAESLQPAGGGNFASAWGDMEWHATTDIEIAEFYADATTIRRQQALRPAGNIMVGNDACVYGRESNVRNCATDVHALNQRITFPYNGGTATVDRQVFMTGYAGTTGGDSGGGWSWNFEVLGIHQGTTNGTPRRSVWGIADYLDEALGVRVIVQP